MPELSLAFLTTPEGWAAMVTLIAMEVVLGIDNLVFIAILADKLPPHQRDKARLLGVFVNAIGWGVVANEACAAGLPAPPKSNTR